MQLSVPKSDSSNRIALVLPVYIDLIKEHKQYRTGLFVFGKKDGSPNDPRKIEDSFSRFLRRIGIINVSFHTLRHPYVKHTTKKYNSEKQKTQATKIVDLIAWGFCFCFVCYSKRSWTL